MKQLFKKTVVAALLGYIGSAAAFTFETENVSGSFDSTITVGVGVRASNTSCGLVSRDSAGMYTGNAGPTGSGAPSACLETTAGIGDQGNLNYEKGDAFTTYLKGSHELLLKLPERITFLGRVSWLKDFSATHDSGIISAGNPTGKSQPTDASDDLSFKARLLDFWVSKEFSVGEQTARVRVGNQVISWGESLFLPGGINQTNAMDFMRLSQPGTQLKEVFLPAPIASIASGLGGGVNVEAYVQGRWNESYYPPTGSYWSPVNGLGKGYKDYGFRKDDAKDSGQYGVAVRWQPEGTQLNLGLYGMRYHEKGPQLNLATGPAWVFPEDRKMFGVSANFPVGDWAIGTELSYRPKDAVSLNPNLGCAGNNGDCFVDEKKFQFHLTGILSMTPGDYGGILKLLGGAQTATLLAEVVGVRYPDLKRVYNGDPIGAGVWGWGNETDITAVPRAVGTKNSWGYNLDFSWVYDGTLIPGWQVTPGVYFFHAVSGRTPNISALFMEGAKSANFYMTFTQNPANWQFGVNYAKFWGGKSVFDQPYKDRDFVGAYVSHNF